MLLFGDIVVVENNLIGVVVKVWCDPADGFNYDVYVRSYNGIKNYTSSQVERYGVRHKELSEEEFMYQQAYVNSKEV